MITALALIFGSLFLAWFASRLSFEIDPQTGKKRLRKSSFLGRYYNLVSMPFYEEWARWRNLNSCVVVQRVWLCSWVDLFILTVSLLVAAGFFFFPAWIIASGWGDPASTMPFLVKLLFVSGLAVWFAGLIAGIVVLFFNVLAWLDDHLGGPNFHEYAILTAYRDWRDKKCQPVEAVD